MAELACCPFCGGTKLLICDSACAWHESGKAYAVSCRTKGCHGAIFSLGYDLFSTPAEAIAAWNNRTPDPEIVTLRARVAELEGESKRLESLAADHFRNSRRLAKLCATLSKGEAAERTNHG